MTSLEHKECGALGSEFIVHHRTYKPRRLVLSLLITSALACALQIYELDVVLLWSMSVCLGVLLLYRLVYKVKKEAVLVLPSIGVQVKTQYWLGGLETHFFDKACVRGIVINEAVTMHSVLCYLAVLLTSGCPGHTQQLFPLFTVSKCSVWVAINCDIHHEGPFTWLGMAVMARSAGPGVHLSGRGEHAARSASNTILLWRSTPTPTCTSSLVSTVITLSFGRGEGEKAGIHRGGNACSVSQKEETYPFLKILTSLCIRRRDSDSRKSDSGTKEWQCVLVLHRHHLLQNVVFQGNCIVVCFICT